MNVATSPQATPAHELEGLFRQHADSVFRAAYRITGSASDAEDVVQTVFLRLLKADRAPELAPAPGAYLRRAAINAGLDVMRRRRRDRERSPSPGPQPQVEDRRAGPEQRAGSREMSRELQKALGELSPRSAEIFALRYFEGLANRQIAELLNTSAGVVGVLLHRARRRLQKSMRHYVGEAS